MPPTLVFHGTGDKVCPFIGAQRFHEAMQKAGNHCELVSHENGVHGYFLYDLALFDQVLAKTDDFLTSLGFIEPHVFGKDTGGARGCILDAACTISPASSFDNVRGMYETPRSLNKRS